MTSQTRADELEPARFEAALRPLEEAATLPAAAFTSPEVHSREIERIFAREWLCVGREDQIPEPGDYFTLDLLDDALVVVRGQDGEIRVLSRICRHRAAEVVKGSGNTRSFQCPYHSWTYGLDGRLVGAPHMESAAKFDREQCGLPALRCESWEGWIFANFDLAAQPLGPQLAALSALLARYRMSEAVAVATATFDSPFNWKVLVDNFMEAYHHIAVHRDTLQPIFPAALSNTPDNEGPYSVLVMPERPGFESSGSDAPRLGPLEDDEARRLVAAVVYPFHLFALSAEMLTWYQILPERFDRFTLRIYSCFPRQTLDDPKHRAFVEGMQNVTKTIHEQDIGACESTWAGLRARSFEAGRLAPLEKPIWQFNRWWIARMTEGGDS